MELLANELRIGNLVNFGCISGIYPSQNSYQIIFGGLSVEVENIKPIQLTEEWLLKFGFEKLVNNKKCNLYHQKDSRFLFALSKNNVRHVTILNESTHIVNTAFKYVHQLQNLYFALTGEELSITA
jgi:hypothetical protein